MRERICSQCGFVAGTQEKEDGFLPARTGLLPGLLEMVLWALMLIPGMLSSLYRHFRKPSCPQCKSGVLVEATGRGQN